MKLDNLDEVMLLMAKPETLKRMLIEQHINPNIADNINNGYEDVTDKSPKKKKITYLFHAVSVLENELDKETLCNFMQSCACTVGSSVDKYVAQFAKQYNNLSLAEKIHKLCAIKHLGSPVLQEDGTILINSGVAVSGVFRCPCPQINGAEITEPTSFTYCMCCSGHYKYQYENALGIKLEVKQLSSPLESAGKHPCVFVLTPIDTHVV